MDIVEETWKKIGCRVKAIRDTVFVRTHPLPQMTKSGLLHLPPKEAEHYGHLPKGRHVMATVLSCGSGVKSVKCGDNVCFMRMPFSRWKYMGDRTLIGWIKEEDLIGIVDDAEVMWKVA